MSLLNQMLNDLEQRRAEAGAAPTMHREIRPLPVVRQSSLWPRLVVLGVLIVSLALVAYWAMFQRPATPAAPASAVTPVTAAQVSDVALPVLSISPPSAAVALAEPTPPAPPESRPVVPAVSAANLQLSERLSLPAPVVASPAPTLPETAAIEKRTIEINPREQAERLYRSGINQLAQGREQDGVTTLRAALRDDPEHFAARQTLVKVLLDRRAFAAAEGELDEGLQRLPKQTAWALLLARLRVDRGDAAAALAVLERHENDAMPAADYQAAMAAVLQRLNRLPEAEARFERATLLEPANGRWWLGLGMTREAQGKIAEAREAFRVALTSNVLSADLRAYAEARLR